MGDPREAPRVFSRRGFLVLTGIGLPAAGLAACAPSTSAPEAQRLNNPVTGAPSNPNNPNTASANPNTAAGSAPDRSAENWATSWTRFESKRAGITITVPPSTIPVEASSQLGYTIGLGSPSLAAFIISITTEPGQRNLEKEVKDRAKLLEERKLKVSTKNRKVAGHDAVQISGRIQSMQSGFENETVIFVRGSERWSISTNESDEKKLAVFNRMVDSLQFNGK